MWNIKLSWQAKYRIGIVPPKELWNAKLPHSSDGWLHPDVYWMAEIADIRCDEKKCLWLKIHWFYKPQDIDEMDLAKSKKKLIARDLWVFV